MRLNRSPKKDGHCSRYVERKKSVSVCENLFRMSADSSMYRRQHNQQGVNLQTALDSADPKRYSDCM